MEDFHSPQEEKNRRRGIALSIVIHLLLVALALLPLLTYPDPPLGQEGIVVNLGMIDIGEGDEAPARPAPAEVEPVELPQEEEIELPQEEEIIPPEEIESEPAPAEPEPVKEREVVTTEDPEAIALRKAEEERKKREAEELKKQREEEARRRAEAEARRKAEEEARKKAEEEARRKAEADKLKNEIGGLFPEKNKDGKGEGNTGKQGTQGDPSGDPDATKLEGISTGSGKVGGGLDGRGVLAAPKVEDDTQKQGTVVIEVCVDEDGKVIGTPTYTQRGSTTSDSDLIRIAVTNAKKWKFSKGNVSKQCGTITYRFIVR